MLYQDALYTVLHRAGTMDPHHVDDQETLLLYLQQVSSPPTPCSSPVAPAEGLPAVNHLSPHLPSSQVFHSSPEEHAKALEHVQRAKVKAMYTGQDWADAGQGKAGRALLPLSLPSTCPAYRPPPMP